jgi:hypothetical protein
MDSSIPTVLLIIGGILFVIGLIVALTNIKNMKRRGRIIRTPTSPVTQAPGNGPVEIKGRIVPGEQGVVLAPFSGRQGVWVKIGVSEYRSTGRSGYWATLVDETDFRPFFVDDGSGAMARVDPIGANVILDANTVASSGTFSDASPHVQGFLASRGLSTTNWLGFNKRMRFTEQVLLPGNPLYALGPSRREAGPPVNDGYRMVPGSQLVLFAMPGEVGELILTNKTEEQLVSKFFWTFTGGLIAAGLGTVMGLLGLVSLLFVDSD